ncbi:Gfo/Idh/MocA family protein [Flavimaricola marinus]|uniref:4-carboxy-2-hydroxymuconate-6-semialdehyde dehydrogenase n=1 Tax=Flavimaricola marinus TaxID=1819565 RepID=A0A238LIC4_9RHOB|nr:Gfo/Idh/MocA family oxidoreductase [Flavimaricola marinus]SMY08706.1 4-carboxy-2-hydroxymuconate-6-semialdehyde dehydrogenase [Flavimaricola marinus]
MSYRLGIAGAGLIGHRHAEAVAQARGATLVGIADPAPAAKDVAAGHDCPHFATLGDMIASAPPDGIILATPNDQHLPGAMACIAAGIPALIEKPLSTDLESARDIVAAGESAGVPLMTGHHRRHNPLIKKAKSAIDAGAIGRITAVQGTTWLHKPDAYFEAEWRTKPGAGPVYLNLSHDIDLMRHLCGEVVSVHAMDSNVARGFEVEDTAVILLRFANGALGTLSVSDTIPAPWSWELTARENPAYPATSQACYLIGGDKGSLSLPDLTLWSHPGKPGWWEPISATKLIHGFDDPLVQQIEQFVAVIAGRETPLVSARDGLNTQAVIEAVKTSARTGHTVPL